jgi:hypothetical protein
MQKHLTMKKKAFKQAIILVAEVAGAVIDA